jgi:hypothetical protein
MESVAFVSAALPTLLDVRSVALPASPLHRNPTTVLGDGLDRQHPGRSRRSRGLRLAKLYCTAILYGWCFFGLHARSSQGLRITLHLLGDEAGHRQQEKFSPSSYNR